MATSRQSKVPNTPRIISPSPTPSEAGGSHSSDGYTGPTTRSSARKQQQQQQQSNTSPQSIDEDPSSSDSGQRARARSRDAMVEGGLARRQSSGLTSRRRRPGKANASLIEATALPTNGAADAHLSPAAANKQYWREMGRSPSPLGLIPIHQKWRSFIHRHEIPRKLLHVSIGFITIGLYCTGTQTTQIHNVLLTLLIPITLTDMVRHRYWQVNRCYIRCLGALMRESEVDGYNGVISYLLGAWAVMRFCPKDLAVMSILLLSWCDTAASTFGRLWGHLTPKVRKGKSLAGSAAACVTGIMTAAVWWGWLGPLYAQYNYGEHAFAFQGRLVLAQPARRALGWSLTESTVSGGWALGTMSLAAGVIASVSEALDVFGWDDNLTIPVLCGTGMWAFLRSFG